MEEQWNQPEEDDEKRDVLGRKKITGKENEQFSEMEEAKEFQCILRIKYVLGNPELKLKMNLEASAV